VANAKHIPLSNYSDENLQRPVFALNATPNFSPVDFQFGVPQEQGMVGVC